MSAAAPPNLLDEALGLHGGRGFPSSPGRFVLVEDCVETSGAFVLHHLLKRALSAPPGEPRGAVVLVALAHTFSHYERVLRKLGCNLTAQRDNGSLHFIDMLNLEIQDEVMGSCTDSGFLKLFGKIQEAVRIGCLSQPRTGHFTIVIDDISLLEVAAHGSANHVLDILHYCLTLTSEMNLSMVVQSHLDIYLDMEPPSLQSHLEYLADTMIKAEPLATGLAADIHGQLTVINKRTNNEQRFSGKRIHNFHFRVKENCVDYFYPGRHV